MRWSIRGKPWAHHTFPRSPSRRGCLCQAVFSLRVLAWGTSGRTRPAGAAQMHSSAQPSGELVLPFIRVMTTIRRKAGFLSYYVAVEPQLPLEPQRREGEDCRLPVLRHNPSAQGSAWQGLRTLHRMNGWFPQGY